MVTPGSCWPNEVQLLTIVNIAVVKNYFVQLDKAEILPPEFLGVPV